MKYKNCSILWACSTKGHSCSLELPEIGAYNLVKNKCRRLFLSRCDLYERLRYLTSQQPNVLSDHNTVYTKPLSKSGQFEDLIPVVQRKTLTPRSLLVSHFLVRGWSGKYHNGSCSGSWNFFTLTKKLSKFLWSVWFWFWLWLWSFSRLSFGLFNWLTAEKKHLYSFFGTSG